MKTRELKYVIVKTPTKRQTAVIFHSLINHKTIADSLTEVGEVISGGFFYLSSNSEGKPKVSVIDREAGSIDQKPRDNDILLILKTLYPSLSDYGFVPPGIERAIELEADTRGVKLLDPDEFKDLHIEEEHLKIDIVKEKV